MSSAVIGSGVQVAMVDNASGIHKAFLKLFINGIIVVQTNATLHTLKPRSSHVENLRSVWSWSAEIFEAHTDTQTDRDSLLKGDNDIQDDRGFSLYGCGIFFLV